MNYIYQCQPYLLSGNSSKNQQRVRALGFWFANETGFYFQTSYVKEFPHQLEQNPRTEILFYHQEGIIGTKLRITGEVEFIHDLVLNEKALNDSTFLKSFGLTVDSLELVLFRIAHGSSVFLDNGKQPETGRYNRILNFVFTY